MTPSLNETFAEDIRPEALLPILSHIAGQTIVREKTLVIFDEVQLCERALTSLKYFCEEAPGYHIAVAGSLLGVAVNRAQFSFPVGKVDMKTMYPMDMEEFMLAMGENDLVARIRACFQTDTPLPSACMKRQCGSTANTSSSAACRNVSPSLPRPGTISLYAIRRIPYWQAT